MIDLDLPAPDAPAPPPHRRRRWWLPGLLIALVLPADGPPTPPAPAVVIGGDTAHDMSIDGRDLYVRTTTALTAYRLPHGARRWSVPVEPTAQLLAASGGRVVLAVKEPQTGTAALVGLDAATGTQVWRVDGYVPSLYGATGATGVVVARPDPVPPLYSDSRLSGFDLRTGAVRWSLGAPAGYRTLVYAGPDRLEVADLDPDGTLRIRSTDSGQVVRTAAVHDLDQVNGFDLSGDRLLAYRAGLGTFLETSMYDLITGRRLWHRTDEPGGVALWWCGRVLCSGTPDQTEVLDPDTGSRLWTMTAGDGIVLDTATRRTVRLPGGWGVVGHPADRPVLIAGGALVARLDPQTSRIKVLGRASEHWYANPQCLATAQFLACRLDHVSVWPL
ncbi:PQQ-binding-like beta-propeller repeat protein [Dactylosporangium sp. CA-139066]|uniref:outer membrane protein assembly factor BamB family protein n=1 Tax=Dactylosporangium sp. CA-139066 TaxID=3239930 RepID=UPI003D920B6B